MSGKEKRLLARILSFIWCVILLIPALPMHEARADGWCTTCHASYDDVNYCKECGNCEDCVEICERCEETCVNCHLDSMSGGESDDICPDCGRCTNGADYCMGCGRCEDCIDLCDRCTEICTWCHTENPMFSDPAEDYAPCPDCGRCKGDGTPYCTECGICEDCATICSSCNHCISCGFELELHCEECEECYEDVDRCEDGGEHCIYCHEVCEECLRCLIVMDCELCDYCGLCVQCCESNQCSECGMCAEDPAFDDHFCDDCGACTKEEAERCDECGLCKDCCLDRAMDMGCVCGNECWLNLEEEHFCADCGNCFGAVKACLTCWDNDEYRCEDCCAELSMMLGCDCATPVCVNADDFLRHMSDVHGGVREDHAVEPQKTWSFNETDHWHNCRLCDEASHVTKKLNHVFNSNGICIVCGYNKTADVIITSQPKDRHGEVHYNGYSSMSKVEPVAARDNTVTFTVVAFGRDAKKGLHYQWYYRLGSGDEKLLDDGDNEGDGHGTSYCGGYCRGAQTPKLVVSIPNDACKLTDSGDWYSFYCVITDDYGNSVTSSAAKLIVKHDYAIWGAGCRSNPNGHVLACAGNGCREYGSYVPHVFGEYKWAVNSDGTQAYMYRECEICGWREKYQIHQHEYDYFSLWEVNFDDVEVLKEDDRHHVYDYKYEYQGQNMRLRVGASSHSVTCLFPGCNFIQTEKHEWGDWHLVNYATQDHTGGIYRECCTCGIQQTWANRTYSWHTHPINVKDGHAKKIDARILEMTPEQLERNGQKLLDGVLDAEDFAIANEGDVVLLLPGPVTGKIATGAKVTIDVKAGLGQNTLTERLTVKELVPGVAYAFAVPKSGRKQSGKTFENVDYQASFINVEFTYGTCSHGRTKTKGKTEATCTEIGYSGDTVCAYCERLIKRGQYVAPTGHGEGVLATRNVPSLDYNGNQIYDRNGYPVYRIHVPEVINCDDNSMRGSYTGDLICPTCGEVIQKGKFYEKKHAYVPLDELDEDLAERLVRYNGAKYREIPSKGRDGYSGDEYCTQCQTLKWGNVVKSQIINKLYIEMSEMATYGSEVKASIFSSSGDTFVMANDIHWFGYDDNLTEYNWFRGVISDKVRPELMRVNVSVMPKEGFWFPKNIEDLEIYFNGKRLWDNDNPRNSGHYSYIGLVNNVWQENYGNYGVACASVSIAETGFCGLVYDVNGGEGNIHSPAVPRGTKVAISECSFTAPEGLVFDHWEIDGKSCQPGETIAVNGLTVARAIWKEAPVEIACHDMYRLYNPNTGEHFYTASEEERDDLASLGWQFEGIAWKAPDYSETPVFRMFNPNSGGHHYTTSEEERDMLVGVGWNYEGIGWYSDDNMEVPLYRLFNPNAVGQFEAGGHHYTTSEEERDNLIALGWQYEGIGWYGVK